MNKVVKVFFITNFGLTILSEDSSRTEHQIANGNPFQDANDRLLDTVNKLFELLRLNDQFILQDDNRLLLSMQASIKNIANKNYDEYKQAMAAARNYSRNNTRFLFKLDKPLNDLFDLDNIYNYIKKVKGENDTTLDFRISTFHSVKEKSLKDLEEFIRVEGMSVEDPESFSADIKNSVKQRDENQNKTHRRPNLKLWQPCTALDVQTRRLYKGKPVPITKYPFLASIHVKGVYVCSGAIVSRDMVITAASCLQDAHTHNVRTLYGETPNGVSVRIGSDYTDKNGMLLSAVGVYFHPQYEPQTLGHNLAIIQVEKHARVRRMNQRIRRVDYHNANVRLPVSIRDIVLLGWGDQSSKLNSNTLSFLLLDIFNKSDCEEIYTRKYVTDLTFCAGFVTSGDGACVTDEGGPAILGSNLVGVVSFGAPVCGTPDAPTVFTDTGAYIDWIDSIIHAKSNVRVLKKRIPTTITEHTLPQTTPVSFFYTKQQQSIENNKYHFSGQSSEKDNEDLSHDRLNSFSYSDTPTTRGSRFKIATSATVQQLLEHIAPSHHNPFASVVKMNAIRTTTLTPPKISFETTLPQQKMDQAVNLFSHFLKQLAVNLNFNETTTNTVKYTKAFGYESNSIGRQIISDPLLETIAPERESTMGSYLMYPTSEPARYMVTPKDIRRISSTNPFQVGLQNLFNKSIGFFQFYMATSTADPRFSTDVSKEASLLRNIIGNVGKLFSTPNPTIAMTTKLSGNFMDSLNKHITNNFLSDTSGEKKISHTDSAYKQTRMTVSNLQYQENVQNVQNTASQVINVSVIKNLIEQLLKLNVNKHASEIKREIEEKNNPLYNDIMLHLFQQTTSKSRMDFLPKGKKRIEPQSFFRSEDNKVTHFVENIFESLTTPNLGSNLKLLHNPESGAANFRTSEYELEDLNSTEANNATESDELTEFEQNMTESTVNEPVTIFKETDESENVLISNNKPELPIEENNESNEANDFGFQSRVDPKVSDKENNSGDEINNPEYNNDSDEVEFEEDNVENTRNVVHYMNL